MAKIKKMGRPMTIQWGKISSLWRRRTNAEIAQIVGCSITNVYVRRKALIEKALEKGKKPDHYICKLPKWTHQRQLD